MLFFKLVGLYLVIAFLIVVLRELAYEPVAASALESLKANLIVGLRWPWDAGVWLWKTGYALWLWASGRGD